MHPTHRRDFLKLGFLSSAVFLMSGCELLGITTPKETIQLLVKDLFPKAKELGISTSSYIDVIFAHSRITQEEKKFLKNGVKLLNESAYEKYKSRYTQLAKPQRLELLEQVAQTQWGTDFMDSVLRYTLEATLGDPIYGGNNNEAGWKWLGYEAAKPQPKKAYL
jgi:gluconate 2-dehydrogenase gamma chain